jgi:hypothetical protein
MTKKIINFEKMPTTADKEIFADLQKELLDRCLEASSSATNNFVELDFPQIDPLETPGLMFAAANWLLMASPPKSSESKKQTKKTAKRKPLTNEELQIELSANLLTSQLQLLSFSVREHKASAISLWNNFQNYLQQRFKENLPGKNILLFALLSVARETDLELSQNLKIAIQEIMFADVNREHDINPNANTNISLEDIKVDFDAKIKALEDSNELSPFGLAENLISNFQHLPVDANIALIMQHFRSSVELGYETAVLLTAHPNAKIRNQLISLYESNFTGKEISPVGLRRLIGLRNWLPTNEKTKLDRLIKKVRQQGVECAPMPTPIEGEKQFYASIRDGAGAQMIFMFLPDQNRKRQFVSLLHTFPKGLKDSMIQHQLPKSEEKIILNYTKESTESSLRKVEVDFIHRFIEAGLATNLKKGTIPPIDLLEIAESLGVPYWQPNALDVSATLKELKEKAGDNLHSFLVQRLFIESKRWAKAAEFDEQYGFVASWLLDENTAFEDLLQKELEKKERKKQKPIIPFNEVEKAAIDFFESDRQTWLHTMLWTALLGAHSLEKRSLKKKINWEVFTLIAEQMHRGTAFEKIPLMKGLAYQTTVNLVNTKIEEDDD